MRFFIGIAIFIVVLGLIQFYFYKLITRSASAVIKEEFSQKFRKHLKFFLGWFNLYPLGLVLYFITYLFYPDINKINFFQSPYTWLIIYPFWVMLIIIGQLLVVAIPLDIIFLIVRLVSKKYYSVYNPYKMKFYFIMLAVFIIYVPARVIYDANQISVHEYSYSLGLKEKMKIILIADIQADDFTDKSKLSRFVKLVNEQKPDLVLIAGDIITGSPRYIKTAAEYISKIKAGYGVYSCVGDHDNWAYREDMNRSLREVMAALKTKNVPMIDNENLKINIKGTETGISFITDNYVERVPSGKIDSLLKANSVDLKILLTHQPNQKMVDAALKNNYNLMLAGHTHGGQISFLYPFIDLSLTLFETRYVKGEFNFEKLKLIVNRGLGVSLSPIRYNSTPEISLINVE